MKKNIIITLIICIITIFTQIPIAYCDDLVKNESINYNLELIPTSTQSETETTLPDTNSRAYVVLDRNSNKILFGKNENTQRKMASTTKIMTAIIIIENCNLEETIEVSKKAANTGGSRLGLKTKDKITIHDLLYGLMLRSGNDAAVCLAEHLSQNIQEFSKLMNTKAKEIGLNQTNFETPHGLDSEKHYTTAYELAILSNYAMKNKIFAEIVGTKNYTITINNSPKQLTNTNELLGNLDGVYGIKTGFTNGANRCLVTCCKRNNIDIICVVLGADTKKFRTQDSIKLLNYTFQNYENINLQNIIEKNFSDWIEKNKDNIYITKGISQNITLKTTDLPYTYLPIKKENINKIQTTISCETTLNSPIKENFKIGEIEISLENNILCKSNIITTCTINKKNTLNYFNYIIKNQFNILKHII